MLTYCKGLFVLVWGHKPEQTAQKAAIHSTQTQPWTVYFMILGRIALGEHMHRSYQNLEENILSKMTNVCLSIVSHNAREARGPLPEALLPTRARV